MLIRIINKKNIADTLYEKNAETKLIISEIEIILEIIDFILVCVINIL